MCPLQNVNDAGIKVGLIVKYIVEGFGRRGSLGIKITYIDQSAPLGLAHVVKISEEFLAGDSFVYLLGDNIFTSGIKTAAFHR
jgi:glucose-1-phosphate thymidylyltransferase